VQLPDFTFTLHGYYYIAHAARLVLHIIYQVTRFTLHYYSHAPLPCAHSSSPAQFRSVGLAPAPTLLHCRAAEVDDGPLVTGCSCPFTVYVLTTFALHSHCSYYILCPTCYIPITPTRSAHCVTVTCHIYHHTCIPGYGSYPHCDARSLPGFTRLRLHARVVPFTYTVLPHTAVWFTFYVCTPLFRLRFADTLRCTAIRFAIYRSRLFVRFTFTRIRRGSHSFNIRYAQLLTHFAPHVYLNLFHRLLIPLPIPPCLPAPRFCAFGLRCTLSSLVGLPLRFSTTRSSSRFCAGAFGLRSYAPRTYARLPLRTAAALLYAHLPRALLGLPGHTLRTLVRMVHVAYTILYLHGLRCILLIAVLVHADYTFCTARYAAHRIPVHAFWFWFTAPVCCTFCGLFTLRHATGLPFCVYYSFHLLVHAGFVPFAPRSRVAPHCCPDSRCWFRFTARLLRCLVGCTRLVPAG